MNELIEKVEIDDGFYIYLQSNSKVWLSRFKIDGKWISRTTKQRDKAKAITSAIKVRAVCDTLHAHGVTIQTKAFRDVAELAIKRMEEAMPGSKGQGSFADYVRFLRKYHIPYFDRTRVNGIDREKLSAFDDWRIQKAGRQLTKSTVNSHNAALMRVFDEAVLRKWMQPMQVPDLSVASGSPGTRRDYFTADEVRTISDAFPAWIDDSVTQRSKDIRQLLYYYFHVAVYTGMRPGTEIDSLRWSDLVIRSSDEIPHILITVRKGKTTMYTGPRVVMAYDNTMEMILDMHENSRDGDEGEVPDDWDPLIFRLPDGSTTDQLGRNFTALLKRLKLEKGPSGKRTMYSLRHTYITMQLLERVSPDVIAHQCGTSADMIRLHYNHLTAQVFKKELIGNPDSPLTKLARQYANLA